MATLGRRDVSKKKLTKTSEVPTVGLNFPTVNLEANPIKIQPVTTLGFQPSFLGGPIMREDFITKTGFITIKRD